MLAAQIAKTEDYMTAFSQATGAQTTALAQAIVIERQSLTKLV